MKRTCLHYHGDLRLQLLVLTHPNMTVFRKCNVDNSIPLHFWMEMFSTFTYLKVLDLKFICTDEILELVGYRCPLLEDFNIVSRVDICKSLFNASVLRRNVSDEGLLSVAKLQNLKILTMDPPRNGRFNKIGRCVSQVGIISLISKLPNLQELRIDTCDIGTTLISSQTDIGPLNLQKINCHFASGAGIRKLLTICPNLRELSVTHLAENDKDSIMNEITVSSCNLTRLDLSFFTFSDAVHEMLAIKGQYLTHFSLWEIELSLTFDAILCIGYLCPNLNTLCIGTQSPSLSAPRYYKKKELLFTRLQTLALGNGNFCIDSLLSFFMDCSNLQNLILKYQSKINLDECLIRLLKKSCFRDINYLWFDCTIEVSKEVAMEIIKRSEHLVTFTMDVGLNMCYLQNYITDNNLNLRIGSY